VVKISKLKGEVMGLKTFKVTASQTQYITYEVEVKSTSYEKASRIALARDINKWDDERTWNADELSIDKVEEVTKD